MKEFYALLFCGLLTVTGVIAQDAEGDAVTVAAAGDAPAPDGTEAAEPAVPPGECARNVPADDREDCGFLGMTEEQCSGKGCCWEALPDGVQGPWCFNFIPAEEGDVGTAAPDAGITEAPVAPGDGDAVTEAAGEPGAATEGAVEPVAEGTAAPDAGASATTQGQEPEVAVGTTAAAEPEELVTESPAVSEAGETVKLIPTTQPPPEISTVQQNIETTTVLKATTQAEEKKTEAPTEPPKPTKPKDGKVLILSTQLISNPPYLFEREDVSENVTGKERYEGLVYDFLKAVTDEMGTDFDIKIVDDGKYGTENSDGSFTGMVGEVNRNQAQLGGPLRVTVEREKAVDFTYPFDRYEAVMVFHKRHWNQEPKIESLDDLINQDKVKYGVLNGGDIERYVADSADPKIQKLHKGLKNMYKKDTNQDGIKRARSSSEYVFILEGILAKMLQMKEPCDLTVIPTGFYHRQYAFAVQNKDDLRDRFNHAMVEVMHSKEYFDMINKWYGEDECALASASSLLLSLSSLVLALFLSFCFN